MCAITGSFSQNKLTDLYRLNAYRGELSYSLSAFSFDEHKVRLETMMQDRDRMPEGLITGLAGGDNKYYIAHSQAPTTNANNMAKKFLSNTTLSTGNISPRKINGDCVC